jgi:hypothetical protein
MRVCMCVRTSHARSGRELCSAGQPQLWEATKQLLFFDKGARPGWYGVHGRQHSWLDECSSMLNQPNQAVGTEH